MHQDHAMAWMVGCVLCGLLGIAIGWLARDIRQNVHYRRVIRHLHDDDVS